MQRLRTWIDTDGDGDYSDETTLLDTTAVDDAWSGGYAGLYRGVGNFGSAQLFDDLKIGYDANADGDILDGGDVIQVSDSFSSNAMSLTYDNNGNLTDYGPGLCRPEVGVLSVPVWAARWAFAPRSP